MQAPQPHEEIRGFIEQDIPSMVIDSLNEQFQYPMTDEVFAKVAWIYDRVLREPT